MELEDKKKILYDKLLSNNYFINKENEKIYLYCLKQVIDLIFNLEVDNIYGIKVWDLKLLRIYLGLYDEKEILKYEVLAKRLNTYVNKVGKIIRNIFYEIKKSVNKMSKNLILNKEMADGITLDTIYLKDTGLEVSSVKELEKLSLLNLSNLLTFTQEELMNMVSLNTYLDIILNLKELNCSLNINNKVHDIKLIKWKSFFYWYICYILYIKSKSYGGRLWKERV